MYEGFLATPARSPCNLSHRPGASCQPVAGLDNNSGMGRVAPLVGIADIRTVELSLLVFRFILFCVCFVMPMP